MKKYFYKLIINSEVKRGKSFKYDYKRTKDINIRIKKDSFEIKVGMTKKNNKEDIFKRTNYLIYDAIKKAMLLHLILYSKNIEIKNIELKIDEISINITKEDIVPIYSLINGSLVRKMNNNWSNIELSKVLSYTKTSSDSIIASLYALIMSKSKSNETERFIYLWMSFNGMYNYIDKLNNPNKDRADGRGLEMLAKVFKLGSKGIGRDNRAKIFGKVVRVLENYPNVVITEESHKNKRDLVRSIEKILLDNNCEISVYGYFLIYFSYYLRCNVIHANIPLSLFSYDDEVELRRLRIANGLLEEFLDSNLNKCFSDNYVLNNIIITNVKESKDNDVKETVYN